MDRLTDNIVLYLDYLNNCCNLNVSIHFPERVIVSIPEKCFLKLAPYNYHTNMYCAYVKNKLKSKNQVNKCVLEQREHYKKFKNNESFFNICHAGVYDYVTPVLINDEVIGFVAVSGYRKELPKKDINYELWEKHLKPASLFPQELCLAVIPPLCIMLSRLISRCMANPQTESNAILQYLNEYHTNITLDDLCTHFCRSKSYISHKFKKAYGVSFSQYCNALKLEDARELLLNTDLSVTEIAFESGFNDVSHFIAVFKAKFGSSPKQYKKIHFCNPR